MEDAVIVDVVRSPIGRAHRGSLIHERPDEVGGFVVDALMKRVPVVSPAEVEDLVVGCGVPEGEQGYNIARVMALIAGMGTTVPGTTVSRYCASSLQALRMAAHAIWAGEGDVFVAAGVEFVSRYGRREDHRNLRFLSEDAPPIYISMGLTAENVAVRYGVSRHDQDAYAKRSQDLTRQSRESGFWAREIVPVPLSDGTVMREDDSPRPDTTLEGLAQLTPAFREGGTVTAGNSCPLNDGAAAVLVMSARRARALGLRPRARIVATSVSALDPAIMGMGPVKAVKQVLKRAGMTLHDIDIVELNEAFAAQVLAVQRELDIPMEKLNPFGGSIAVGHPYGMTGARLCATLLNGLDTLDQTLGLETLCVGGGQGMAMIVERLN
ncbi:acetyl-CoA acetyltransferase [Sulfobacillus acidophilus TPY]|uniref:Acetyl-CoA acetyltransferase n=1 Tax=Sulfobacillus acidophilus (strain ATCC 700253 / DSM 10332 / NAL) TaxID=679936 RepID=G8TSB6_SULAD|nr:acetyl-CoA acetyltransferase [Sulfobacillus acidophilus TPY]AEW05528.1 acetyl-CoA acetyltransferase [Sulfobacillus acidophilus DSM 10332]